MRTEYFWGIAVILLLCPALKAISPDVLNQNLFPEDVDEDYLEQYLEEFIDDPLIWNSCCPDEIAALPLNEDFAARVISAKKEFKKINSWREIQSTGNFNKKEIQAIKTFFIIDRQQRNQSSGFQNYTSLKMDGSIDIYRHLARGKIGIGPRLTLGFIAENDPGERSLWDYHNVSITSRLSAGNLVLGLSSFKLGWGHGLLFSRRNLSLKGNSISRNIIASTPRFSAYIGSDENRYLQGAYVNKTWNRLSVFSFFSSRNLDATVQNSVAISFRETGIHRSATELAAKDILKENTLCGGLIFTRDWFKGGMLLFQSQYSFPVDDYHSQSRQSGGSFFQNIVLGNLRVSGELALLSMGEHAFIEGFIFQTDRCSIGMQYRYFSDYFGARLSSSMKEYTGSNGNERGLNIGFQSRLKKSTRIGGYVDFYSENRSFENAAPPDFGNEAVVYLYHRGSLKQTLNLRLKREVSSGVNEKYQSALAVRYPLPLDMSLSFRGVVNVINGRYGAGCGIAISANALNTIALTMGTTQFYSPAYESKVYLYEPGIPMRFNVVSMYGTGSRLFMVIEKRFQNNIDIALSYKHQSRRLVDEPVFVKTFLLEFQMLVDL